MDQVDQDETPSLRPPPLPPRGGGFEIGQRLICRPNTINNYQIFYLSGSDDLFGGQHVRVEPLVTSHKHLDSHISGRANKLLATFNIGADGLLYQNITPPRVNSKPTATWVWLGVQMMAPSALSGDMSNSAIDLKYGTLNLPARSAPGCMVPTMAESSAFGCAAVRVPRANKPFADDCNLCFVQPWLLYARRLSNFAEDSGIQTDKSFTWFSVLPLMPKYCRKSPTCSLHWTVSDKLKGSRGTNRMTRSDRPSS